MDQSLFAKRIRAIRHALGMTQAEFAESVGVTREHVGRWESGKVGTTARRLELICAKLGLTAAQFWDAEYVPRPKSDYTADEVSGLRGDEQILWPHQVAEASEVLSWTNRPAVEPSLPSGTPVDEGADYFWIRAENDAMERAGIARGDLVLVRRQTTVEPGELALVRIVARGLYIRRIQLEGELVLLIPANDRFPVQLHQKDEVEIIGRVRRILQHV